MTPASNLRFVNFFICCLLVAAAARLAQANLAKYVEEGIYTPQCLAPQLHRENTRFLKISRKNLFSLSLQPEKLRQQKLRV